MNKHYFLLASGLLLLSNILSAQKQLIPSDDQFRVEQIFGLLEKSLFLGSISRSGFCKQYKANKI